MSSAPTERVVGRSAFRSHTVDGSEIRRSLVEIGSLSHYLQVFYLHPRCCRISEPSTVSVSSMKKIVLSYQRPILYLNFSLASSDSCNRRNICSCGLEPTEEAYTPGKRVHSCLEVSLT